MDETFATKVLDMYGLDYVRIYPEQKGYRNHCRAAQLRDGSMVNIILYKNEPYIARTVHDADTVSNFLADRGLLTRVNLDKLLTFETAGGMRLIGIYNYLPGATIAWHAYTKDHIKLLGKTMSDMHYLLAGSLIAVSRSAARINTRLAAQASAYFASVPVAKAMREKLGLELTSDALKECEKVLRLCDHLPNHQPLHMDFVRGNILFDDKPHGDLKHSITGILDFEKTAYGHPVLDIARTMAFLLVDCKSTPVDKIYKYFLESGYNKRGMADYAQLVIKYRGEKIDVLESLINWFLLYDFYKFLMHTPYESLQSNQHFIRTRDILMTRKMLKYKT